MSGIETVAVKGGAHSFNHIRRATGLRLSDDQSLDLIKENEERLEFNFRRIFSSRLRLSSSLVGLTTESAMQARPGPLPLLSLAFLAAWASIEPLSTRPRKPQGVVPPAPGRLPAGKKLYVRNLT